MSSPSAESSVGVSAGGFASLALTADALPGLAAAALVSWTAAAGAHGMGERYALPLPLNLYLAGAALIGTAAIPFLPASFTSRMASALPCAT